MPAAFFVLGPLGWIVIAGVVAFSVVFVLAVVAIAARRSNFVRMHGANLRPCPDCGHFISVRAAICPRCGGPAKGF